MKILLTGVLPKSVWTIAERVARGGHQLTVLGQIREPDRKIPGVQHTKLNLAEKETVRYIQASGFDAILFFFACQCEDQREYGAVQGSQLDAIFEILNGAGGASSSQFVLITDQRVFGEGQQGREDEIPIPDTPTGVMIRAAESCVSCAGSDTFKTLIVRTTSIYEPGDPESFFSIAALRASDKREFVLRGTPDTPCDFLHAEDLGVFLEYAVSMQLEGVVHAPQGVPSTYAGVISAMQRFLPDLSVVYMPARRCRQALNGRIASSIGWVPRHDFRQELAQLCQIPSGKKAGRRKAFVPKKLGKTIIKWAEVILLWLAAVWLTRQGKNSAVLSSVDFMLLYTALMGFVHGRTAGIAAAVLTCIWYCQSFIGEGGAPSDLLFNTDHWLPMSIYVLFGSLFGYAQDRQRSQMALLEQEREDIRQERDFIEGIYQRTYEDRNRLKEQIYHYRDSYGRIYQITRELDTLQPVQVFLSTLHVLESTLQNNSVAIYECNQGNDFTRLVVRSREMKSTPRSMRISEYAPMYDVLKKGKLYANHNLTDGYPVYALPVMDQGEIIAVLMLWNVPFEQQSLYMENLLSVVAGLVQSALIRAIGYHRQVADLYYENTHILMPQAFMTALGIYQTIRSRHMGTHVLVRLHADREMDLEVIDRYIGKLVRSTDLVGRLEDGCYYVLFPQASAEQLPGIEGRFNSYGIRCEVVSGDLNIA